MFQLIIKAELNSFSLVYTSMKIINAEPVETIVYNVKDLIHVVNVKMDFFSQNNLPKVNMENAYNA
jgi:hypothetical protein